MPRSELTANELQTQYGDVLSTPPLSDAACAEALYSLLIARQPPIAVSRAAVKYWWSKYRLPEGAETAGSAQELEEKYGDVIRHLALEYPTAYKLCKALRERDPPLLVTVSPKSGFANLAARGWRGLESEGDNYLLRCDG